MNYGRGRAGSSSRGRQSFTYNQPPNQGQGAFGRVSLPPYYQEERQEISGRPSLPAFNQQQMRGVPGRYSLNPARAGRAFSSNNNRSSDVFGVNQPTLHQAGRSDTAFSQQQQAKLRKSDVSSYQQQQSKVGRIEQSTKSKESKRSDVNQKWLSTSPRPDFDNSVIHSTSAESILEDSENALYSNPFPYVSTTVADMMHYTPYTAHAQMFQPHPAWADLNNYPASQILRLEDAPTRMITAGNDVTGETVIGLASRKVITFLTAKMRDPQDPAFRVSPFAIFKLQEVHLPTGCVLSCFDLGPVVSVNLPPRKLTYAIAPRMDKVVYVYQHDSEEEVPRSLDLDQELLKNPSKITRITTPYAVAKIAIGGDKFLACALSNGTLGVWDIPTGHQFVTFILRGHISHLSWHKSEPFKLMAVEVSGWVKFFNVYKQTCFMSFNVGRAPLYTADWSPANPLITSIGWSEGFTVLNTSQMNTNMSKIFETPQENVSQMLFNPHNDRVIATLGREPGVIKLWKNNFPTHVWSHYNGKLEDIAWIHGQPFVIGLSYRTLHFFNASVI